MIYVALWTAYKIIASFLCVVWLIALGRHMYRYGRSLKRRNS